MGGQRAGILQKMAVKKWKADSVGSQLLLRKSITKPLNFSEVVQKENLVIVALNLITIARALLFFLSDCRSTCH